MADQQDTVLVVGAGVAGTTAALALAERGLRVIVLEKGDFIGGHAAHLTCKALDDCQRCNACLAEERFREFVNHPGIEIMPRARIASLAREGGGFSAKIEQGPAYIDPAACTGCGLCVERCPNGAVVAAPFAADPQRLAITPSDCLYFVDGKSTLCREACPEEAIDFGRPTGQSEIKAQAVVLATGFEPYKAASKTRLGYGQFPGVITALELEERLREHGHPLDDPSLPLPKRVGFVQCVGSRDIKGHNYCSRVCCAYALRLGRLLKNRYGAEVSVFYIDLQNAGQAMDEFLAQAKDELELIPAVPYDVYPAEGGSLKVPHLDPNGPGMAEKELDLLVLSVAMAPAETNAELAAGLELELDEHGFLPAGLDHGVFTAGAASGPRDVAESVASAGRAAANVLHYLKERQNA